MTTQTDVTPAQGNEVVRLANAKGLTMETFQVALLDTGIIADVLQAVKQGSLPERNQLRKAVGLEPIYPPPTVTDLGYYDINYDEPLADLLTRGNYDWKNGDMNARNFPSPSNGIIGRDLVTVWFDRDLSDEEIAKGLQALELEAADSYELLNVGAKQPELQRQYPIPALGQECRPRGYRYVACLSRGVSGRHVYLYCLGRRWGGNCRFLARRKRK